VVLWALFAGVYLSFWSEIHYNSIYAIEGKYALSS